MKKTGLPFRPLAQGIRSEIDLVSLIVEPEDFMTVVLKFEIVEAGGIGTEEFEHLTLCEQRPQVHDAGKSILPDDLENTE
ncbi:MAG TPA: hypothetical protein VGO49_13635 [Bradyrhizobium sp.]|jgi:hypothetical protein|nr:hypothetical protein [Bradyrhizobium sp.]